MGLLVGTFFVELEREYVCAESRTRSEPPQPHKIGKVGEKGGGGGENTHELEKNAKMLEK